MGDTKKPSRDKGMYIMTWYNPADDGDKHSELINGFGDYDWVLIGSLQLRWITETVAQNRIIRVREQYSYWSGDTMKDGEHILTRTLDGKVLRTFYNRDKPVCPKCNVNVLVLRGICPKCYDKEFEAKINSCSKACVSNRHNKCKGRGLIWCTGEPCICDCHKSKTPEESVILALKNWF